MFPPVDESVLRANPKFAALHKTLTTTLLNPSGSSKAEPDQAARDAVRENLKHQRLSTAKTQLLRDALFSLPLDDAATPTGFGDLPEPLIELLHLLTLRLSTPHLTPEASALLASDPLYSSLSSYIQKLAALASTHLETQTQLLLQFLPSDSNGTSNDSKKPLRRALAPSPASQLQTSIDSSLAKLDAQKAELNTSQLELLRTTVGLLATYRSATTLTITALEQLKHSLYAKAQTASAELLAAQAQTENLTLQRRKLEAEREVYTDEAVRALERYVLHLKDAGNRVVERGRQAEKELAAYGVVGRRNGEGEDDDEDVQNAEDEAWQRQRRREVVMKEIARVYGEVLSELNEVRADVERLSGSRG